MLMIIKIFINQCCGEIRGTIGQYVMNFKGNKKTEKHEYESGKMQLKNVYIIYNK